MHKQQNSPYEQMIWNRTRFPKTAFFREMDQVRISKAELPHEGYLLTIGDRGSLVGDQVFHNGDLYRRTVKGPKMIYGSVSVLRLFDLECFLLSEREIIQRALGRADAKRIKRLGDEQEFDVAMLDQWPVVKSHPYSCCIYFDGEDVRALNPEPKANYNEPRDQFRVVSDLTDGLLLARFGSHFNTLAS